MRGVLMHTRCYANSMKLFKTTTLTWWQLGLLKAAVLSLSVAIGATWSEFFLPYVGLLVTVGFFSSLYLVWLWSKK